MTAYQLEVQIATSDLPILLEGGYQLCIAKMVNGYHTVVWSGSHHFLQHNIFEWVDEYQVSGANHFQVGALVEASTNSENIQPGQTCVLDKTGLMGYATGTAHPTGHFSVINEYGATSIGIHARFGGEMRPVFVTPTPIIMGGTTFEPVNNILVWFSSNQTTGTMMLGANANSTEVIYEGRETSKTLVYRDGRWA